MLILLLARFGLRRFENITSDTVSGAGAERGRRGLFLVCPFSHHSLCVWKYLQE